MEASTMSEIGKIEDQLIEKTKELKEATKEATQEKDPVVKEGLLQRIEKIADDLDIIKIKWQGWQKELEKEREEKKAKREAHEKNKKWYDLGDD